MRVLDTLRAYARTLLAIWLDIRDSRELGGMQHLRLDLAHRCSVCGWLGQHCCDPDCGGRDSAWIIRRWTRREESA